MNGSGKDDLSVPRLLDGGLASTLESMGHDLRDPLWSAKLLLENPSAIEAAHRRFVEAGAQVLTTASYQASLRGLHERGLDTAQALQLIDDATTLARSAAKGHDVWIAASAGPYGAYLADGSEYRGHYEASDAELVEFHRERLQAFSNADWIAFETVPCAREVAAIVRALDETQPEIPAWISIACADDRLACSGESIEACIAPSVGSPHVRAVGVNCCAPSNVLGLLRRIAAQTDLPLIAYPNAGRVYDCGAWHGEPIDPAQLAERTWSWIEAGARLVGGCCQIGPEHLTSMAGVLQRMEAEWPTLRNHDG